jgi:hypothetical protein
MNIGTPKAVLTLAILCLLPIATHGGSEAPATACDGVLFPHQLPVITSEQVHLSEGISVRYHFWTPRVVVVNSTESVVLTVVVSGSPTSVAVFPADGGPLLPLSPVAPSTFEIELQADDLLAGYRVGTARQRIGRLRLTEGDVVVSGGALTINVKDVTIGDTTVTKLSPSMQASERIVNIRRDDPWLGIGSTMPFDATRLFYDLFEDEADFLVLVGNVTPPSNPFYSPIRNEIDGIGLSRFDSGSIVGSPARLQGVISFPRPTLFDLSGHTALHEIAHRWVNFLHDVPVLALGRVHWPISDLAYSLIGFTLPTGAGGTFPFRFREIEEGYLLRKVKRADQYNDFELYLMGLIGPESVGEHIVFLNQDQNDQIRDGGILAGPVEPVRIDDIIAAVGPRVPDSASAPRVFRLATIVLSTGRLLTDDEMSFFEAMAARGESRRRHQFITSGSTTPTRPFFHATRGLAELVTHRPALKVPVAQTPE